jgi:hemerythrin-like domain-containing protein
MNTATDLIRDEHGVILRGLELVEHLAFQLTRGEPVAAIDLVELTDLVKGFVHLVHEGGEERVLYPYLRDRKIVDAAAVLELEADHARGRALAGELALAARAYQAREPEAGRRWARAAWKYVSEQRRHSYKENALLLPIAEKVLGTSDHETLCRELERVHAELAGPGGARRLRTRLSRLRRMVLARNGLEPMMHP